MSLGYAFALLARWQLVQRIIGFRSFLMILHDIEPTPSRCLHLLSPDREASMSSFAC
jgi:hypothetical protein